MPSDCDCGSLSVTERRPPPDSSWLDRPLEGSCPQVPAAPSEPPRRPLARYLVRALCWTISTVVFAVMVLRWFVAVRGDGMLGPLVGILVPAGLMLVIGLAVRRGPDGRGSRQGWDSSR